MEAIPPSESGFAGPAKRPLFGERADVRSWRKADVPAGQSWAAKADGLVREAS